MSIIKSKGTVFSMGIGGASAAIAQMISVDLPEHESETFEADTLDNSDPGIPYKSTGRVEGGSISGEMFFDPSIHTAITGWFAAPPDPDDDPQGTASVELATGSTFDFNIAGVTLGGTVALNDGVKGNVSCKLDGIGTWS